MLLLENVPLAPLTTLQVGGPARFFVEAQSVRDVQDAVELADSRNLPLFVFGGGSNLVIADAGWPGLALKLAIVGIEEREEHGKAIFDAGAGEDWDRFVARTVRRECSGLECLSGIPGSVGGTPVQNVGAYGQDVAQTIESVQVLDLRDMQVRELCNEACSFGYRTSIFNTSERGRYIVLRVSFALEPGGAAHIEYADLKKYFSGWSVSPTLAEAREAVRQIRGTKGMLLVLSDPDSRSAGSFFKNPVITVEQNQELQARAAARRLQIPSYPALEERKKVSAAWLVEHSGFSKGFGIGRVGISRKHALAIVNRGSATASEIMEFKDLIQARVQEIWDVHLEPEPVFVGF
jgi:UDP-N-acetylmuramate dehydrogenase